MLIFTIASYLRVINVCVRAHFTREAIIVGDLCQILANSLLERRQGYKVRDVGLSMLLDKLDDIEPLAQFAPRKLEALVCPICSLATAAPKRKFAFQPGWIRELSLALESLVCPLLQSLVLLKQLTLSHCHNLLHVAPLLDSHNTFLLRGIKDLLDFGSNVSQVRFRGQLKVVPNVTIWHHNSKDTIIIIIADGTTFSI